MSFATSIENVQDLVVCSGSESFFFATDSSMNQSVKIVAGAVFAIAAVLIYLFVIDDTPPPTAPDTSVTAPTPSE